MILFILQYVLKYYLQNPGKKQDITKLHMSCNLSCNLCLKSLETPKIWCDPRYHLDACVLPFIFTSSTFAIHEGMLYFTRYFVSCLAYPIWWSIARKPGIQSYLADKTKIIGMTTQRITVKWVDFAAIYLANFAEARNPRN